MKVAFPKSKLGWVKKNLKEIAKRFGIRKPKVREAKENPDYVVIEEE